MQRKAFTLIELLVVVAISGLLSALAITYSSVGRNAVALSVESSKIAQFILQAKQLSIATYTGSPVACGYGVTLDAAAQTYSIFAYVPNGIASCRVLNSGAILSRGIDPANNEEREYTPGTWQAHLANGVILQPPGGTSLVTVLFYPPTPTVFLSNDGTTFGNPPKLTVDLKTADNQNTASISVNPEGQVNL